MLTRKLQQKLNVSKAYSTLNFNGTNVVESGLDTISITLKLLQEKPSISEEGGGEYRVKNLRIKSKHFFVKKIK